METDAPDMLPPAESITHPLPENHNHPANLPAIGQALVNQAYIRWFEGIGGRSYDLP